MAKLKEILASLRQNPKGVSFNDLSKVPDHARGEVRQVLNAIERLEAQDDVTR